MAAQIKSWRNMLPNIIKKFSRIPDYRNTKSIKHKISVLLMFGLLAFIMRISSRREMNRELSSSIVFSHFKKIFPEIDSIPHADTLERMLEHIHPDRIEEIHIELIKDLIQRKKFKRLLIEDCIPIAIDGTQKLFRQDLLQDPRWCERNVGDPENGDIQQYIYAVEADIALKNGLSIPLITEYLYRENNELEQDSGKQDCETKAFERLAVKLKKYFPRQKIIIIGDAMFATQPIMEMLDTNKWQYIIKLPKNKLKNLSKNINANRNYKVNIPNQEYYQGRKQLFYWENNIAYGYELQLSINLIACCEEYQIANRKTGEIKNCFSETCWISSVAANTNNLHELINLCAKKLCLIENNFNTAKNRGYNYKHAYSYDWNAMQCFHRLMRLGHAINAITEFTKTIKKYIKNLGVRATLKIIKETLFAPWLPLSWYDEQMQSTPELRLQL